MDDFLTLSFCVYSYFYKGICYINPHKWNISSPSMTLYASSSYKCTIMYARKSSHMENYLTQYDSMHPALTNTHTEKSSQMENFLTQYDSMHLALTNTHTHWKNRKFPHPAWLYASSSYKCTYMLEKSSQMECFLTQYDSMPPALTSAHAHRKILTNGN